MTMMSESKFSGGAEEISPGCPYLRKSSQKKQEKFNAGRALLCGETRPPNTDWIITDTLGLPSPVKHVVIPRTTSSAF